jgi:hypothetical protein
MIKCVNASMEDPDIRKYFVKIKLLVTVSLQYSLNFVQDLSPFGCKICHEKRLMNPKGGIKGGF